MSADPRDPSVCPLCRRPNGCGLADGRGDCWCFALRIPSDQRGAIDSDTPSDVCLCQACLSERGRPVAVLRAMAESIRRWR